MVIGLAVRASSTTGTKPVIAGVPEETLYVIGFPVVERYGNVKLSAPGQTTGRGANVIVGDGLTSMVPEIFVCIQFPVVAIV